ncbi:MAG: endonuclease MutS2 [Anaerolineales bacterium]|nr:endonuclease MutS2 [Chloroflexota bacterium]MBL6979694.1 endonuclease MutS2 [Anaerolineales bacterium]
MDEKTFRTLGYTKILERLSEYCAFSASADKARGLKPSVKLHEARQRLAETSEARELLEERPSTSIGGARDIRAAVIAATRQVLLEVNQFLDIKYTLIASRTLRRLFEREGDRFPHLAEITLRLPISTGLVDAITQTLNDRGEILNTASGKLARIRRDLKVEHDRLLAQLKRMINNPDISPYLQENLIMQRDGRYVIPLRADFKGRVKGIVHDQSASGATLFVEPLSVVEKNNKYKELQLEERDEERRILLALTAQVAEHAPALDEMTEALADMDVAFARARFAEDLDAAEPKLHPIKKYKDDTDVHPRVRIRLLDARHPLLDQETVVPIDVELDPQTRALVITGPNTGGKTVSLKTVGLLALMAQTGLHIPAHPESEISLFKSIYADIGDEQSIEQSLSTFSGHITNIIGILERADTNSLVILDELGAGTDPQEGAALARSLLTHLVERGITTLVTTHHPELKAFAHDTTGVINASVEFDLESLQPTYHLTIGLPGRSNALAIAERLGLPGEIVGAARQEIDPAELRADDLLDEIYRQRDISRQARQRADEAKREAEELRTELAERLEAIEDERRGVLEDARHEAKEEVKSVRDEIRDLRKELRRARQPLEVIQQVEEKIDELVEEVEIPVERHVPDIMPVSGPIRLGSKVRVRSLDTDGIVRTLAEDSAEVQIGVLRVRAKLTELMLVGKGEVDTVVPEARSNIQHPTSSTHPSPGVELDLRGQRADDALDVLQNYLERAYLARLPWVRIIHGKGTGKLRKVVRDALQRYPQVISFEAGKQNEGGEGVTIAELRK